MIGVCKFCKCTEMKPCILDCDLDSFNGVNGDAQASVIPCAWLLEDVCTNPACVEAAYLEARPQAEELMQKLDMILEAA